MADTPDHTNNLHTTPLDALHRELGARMVPFAGYAMPVQYDFRDAMAARCKGGVLAEHLHCRASAGMFDVSHMGQASLHGAEAAAALERLVPGDILGLRQGRQRYTLLTSPAGGIIDDLMVAKLAEDRLFLVVNAARKDVDFAHLRTHLPASVTLEEHPDRALIALQGPLAASVMAKLCPPAAALPFLGVTIAPIGGIPAMLSRSGYTGEDGFEISVSAPDAEPLARLLLEQPEIIPIGLGARDSLRLEAGLCLYGHDIDETTTPIEAGLTWVIGKRRKMEWSFPGAMAMRDQLDNGAPRLRVGIRPDGRAPAREGTTIHAPDGTEAGRITSGGFAPSVGAPIAMGYVRRDLVADGSTVQLMVRGKPVPAHIAPMPFHPHRYVR
ncbi:MAG: glycine cleavage system aminomethyltransferase GcvT [Acetobacteraceae bacterium]|nr:glycine cleavage system aminomethyltransferase GcvT [Acetobacteraceae bacterium]MSP28963.1 glycine cleavage system aminomethyltransferase GcvT [Acetobacteraceae bacterium]